MKRFSHLSNNNSRLGLSTPYATVYTDGLSLTSSLFTQGSFSIGLRFSKFELINNGVLAHCFDSITTKNEYWYIDCNGANIRFATPNDGPQSLCNISAAYTIYHLFIVVEFADLNYYLYDSLGNSIASGTKVVTPIVPANTKLKLFNDVANSNYFNGTIFDLFWLESPETYYSDIYLSGGGISASWAYFWPMREGAGTSCTCINTGLVLSADSAFSWTNAPDNSHRWI